MLENIGLTEVALILGLALLIFGPSKLPALGRSIGQSIREFKSSMKDLSSGEASEEKK